MSATAAAGRPVPSMFAVGRHGDHLADANVSARPIAVGGAINEAARMRFVAVVTRLFSAFGPVRDRTDRQPAAPLLNGEPRSVLPDDRLIGESQTAAQEVGADG